MLRALPEWSGGSSLYQQSVSVATSSSATTATAATAGAAASKQLLPPFSFSLVVCV